MGVAGLRLRVEVSGLECSVIVQGTGLRDQGSRNKIEDQGSGIENPKKQIRSAVVRFTI